MTSKKNFFRGFLQYNININDIQNVVFCEYL